MKRLFTFVFISILALSSYAQELGELNTSFGDNGTYVFDPSVAHDMMEKILVQDDGKILTVGGARVGGDNYSIYASRHNADGTLDVTYGENGIVYLKVNPLIYMNYAFDAALDKNGNLFIAGYTFDYTNNSAFVICLDENGFENTEFGNNGYAVSEYGNGIVYEAIDVDSRSRSVVAGYFDDQILVRRYNAKGKLDATFGDEGTTIVVLDNTLWAYCYAYDIKILDDGKMLVTGHKVSADMLYESYFAFFTTYLSNTANRLGNASRIKVIADAAPMEMTRQICAMVGSALIKPNTPVTMVIISPDVRIV